MKFKGQGQGWDGGQTERTASVAHLPTNVHQPWLLALMCYALLGSVMISVSSSGRLCQPRGIPPTSLVSHGLAHLRPALHIAPTHAHSSRTAAQLCTYPRGVLAARFEGSLLELLRMYVSVGGEV